MIYLHYDRSTLEEMKPWAERNATGNEMNILQDAIDGCWLERLEIERLNILAIQFLQTRPDLRTRL